jgi:NifU-like protein involved in Fe-S cluster formation
MTSHHAFKAPLLAGLLPLLCACGVETASTAATAGAIKKNEIEQGRVVQEQVQQQLQKSLDAAHRAAGAGHALNGVRRVRRLRRRVRGRS